MISPDLLANLVITPIGLLLVVVREGLRRSFLPRATLMPGKHTSAGQAV